MSPPCSIVRAILNHMRHAALAQNPFAARFPPLVQANPEISATMAWQFLGSTALRLTISAVYVVLFMVRPKVPSAHLAPTAVSVFVSAPELFRVIARTRSFLKETNRDAARQTLSCLLKRGHPGGSIDRWERASKLPALRDASSTLGLTIFPLRRVS